MPPRVAPTLLPDYALDPAVREQLQLKTFEVRSNQLIVAICLSNNSCGSRRESSRLRTWLDLSLKS